MSPKRYGMYLSPEEDALLLQELDACTVKGRKSELLRNYALLGYQKALDLCSEIQDTNKLTAELAALFGAQGSQHDFRQAAEFVRAWNLQKATAGGGLAPSAPPSAEPANAPRQLPTRAEEAAPVLQASTAPGPVTATSDGEQAARPKTNWAHLGALVSRPSKAEPQGTNDGDGTKQ